MAGTGWLCSAGWVAREVLERLGVDLRTEVVILLGVSMVGLPTELATRAATLRRLDLHAETTIFPRATALGPMASPPGRVTSAV